MFVPNELIKFNLYNLTIIFSIYVFLTHSTYYFKIHFVWIIKFKLFYRDQLAGQHNQIKKSFKNNNNQIKKKTHETHFISSSLIILCCFTLLNNAVYFFLCYAPCKTLKNSNFKIV